VKVVLTIWAVLIQLFGYYNVEAKPPVKNVTAFTEKQTKQYFVDSAALHSDSSPENVHTQSGVTTVKLREQRFQSYTLGSQELRLSTVVPGATTGSFRDTPAPIPVSRLLLFPQHYFW
jgi:hypothetical protein